MHTESHAECAAAAAASLYRLLAVPRTYSLPQRERPCSMPGEREEGGKRRKGVFLHFNPEREGHNFNPLENDSDGG